MKEALTKALSNACVAVLLLAFLVPLGFLAAGYRVTGGEFGDHIHVIIILDPTAVKTAQQMANAFARPVDNDSSERALSELIQREPNQDH